MKIEKFRELFSELSDSDKIRCFNEYAMDYACDEQLYEFDEDFFNMFYENNPTEAVRACFFGNIKNWGDEYLRFNGFGNIVSMSEWEAAEWVEDYVDEIYDHEEIWSQYIDDEEEEESDEDAE